MSATTEHADDVKLEKENWEMINSHVSGIVSNLTMDNLQESYKDLFQVNIILGRNIVCSNILDFTLKKQNSRQMPVLSALITLLNSEIPEIGETLTKELVLTFVEQFNHRDYVSCESILQCLSILFLYDVIHEIVILQILLLLLEKNSLKLIIAVMKVCGWKLALVSKKSHDMIWEKLRCILQTQELPKTCLLYTST